MADLRKRYRETGEMTQESQAKLAKARAAAVLGLSMDAVELLGYPGLTPSMSQKTKMTGPPTPEIKGTKKKGVQEPRIPFTSPDIYQRFGEDPSDAEFIAGSVVGPELNLGKMASGAMALGVLARPLSKRIASANRLVQRGASEDEILKKTGLVAADTKTGWRQPSESLSMRTYGGGKTQLPRELQKQLMESEALSTLRMYLTEEELQALTPETIMAMEQMIQTGKTRTGKPITITHGKDAVPRLDQEEIGAMAFAGRHKKGWYKHSAQQLRNVFQDDTERFIGLLAATSPQTSVEMNMENALRIWKNWDAAGRPTDKAEIKKIMGQSVVGKGTEESVMDAWVNNSIEALTAEEPTEIVLSGPKANSFMKNLLEGYDEVTNDTWMGRAYNVLQDVFGGKATAATEGKGGKGPGYLLSNAATRRAAAFLEKKTGQKWTAAEVQETVWSYTKAIYEKRRKGPGTQKSMQELSQDITAEDIAEVVDFASLMSDPKYSNILKGTRYEERLSTITPFQSEAEIGDLSPYRGFEPAFKRALGGFESQFRETDATRFIKGIRDKVNRSVVASRDGSSKVNRPFTGTSERNPGRSLKGLGKVTRFNLSDADQKRLNSLGYSTPDFYELPQTPEAGLRFQESIIESKNASTYGAAVYVYEPEEYQGMRMFLSKDGTTGFAIKDDDVVSVFNKKGGPHKGTTVSALMLAVQEGGRKLDAFDSALPHIYSKVGFRISSRTAWNDEFAPPEWDKELYGDWNQGEPDVVFMHYDPQSTEVYEQMAGTYDPTDAERNALLRDEYDAAVDLQTQNIIEADTRFTKQGPKAPWQVKERSIVPIENYEQNLSSRAAGRAAYAQ